MSANCGVCNILCVSSGDLIKCAGLCGKEFHLNCVISNYPHAVKTRDSRKKWYCENCKKTLLDAFKKEVFTLILLKVHSNQFHEFKASTEFFANKIDETNKAMDNIKNQYKDILCENQAYKVQNAVLTEAVATLEMKVRDLEQYSQRDNIEISGVPKTAGEDKRRFLETVGRAISVEVRDNNIVAAHRAKTYSKTRTPPLIVRFTNIIRVCIKYVWCREGKFYVRKSDGVSSVRVNCVDDLNKIK